MYPVLPSATAIKIFDRQILLLIAWSCFEAPLDLLINQNFTLDCWSSEWPHPLVTPAWADQTRLLMKDDCKPRLLIRTCTSTIVRVAMKELASSPGGPSHARGLGSRLWKSLLIYTVRSKLSISNSCFQELWSSTLGTFIRANQP